MMVKLCIVVLCMCALLLKNQTFKSTAVPLGGAVEPEKAIFEAEGVSHSSSESSAGIWFS